MTSSVTITKGMTKTTGQFTSGGTRVSHDVDCRCSAVLAGGVGKVRSGGSMVFLGIANRLPVGSLHARNNAVPIRDHLRSPRGDNVWWIVSIKGTSKARALCE